MTWPVVLWFPDSVINFGYYQGKTVGHVLKHNPSYINWSFRNTQRVNLSLEVATKLKEIMAHPNYREVMPNGSVPKLNKIERLRRAYSRPLVSYAR